MWQSKKIGGLDSQSIPIGGSRSISRSGGHGGQNQHPHELKLRAGKERRQSLINGARGEGVWLGMQGCKRIKLQLLCAKVLQREWAWHVEQQERADGNWHPFGRHSRPQDTRSSRKDTIAKRTGQDAGE